MSGATHVLTVKNLTKTFVRPAGQSPFIAVNNLSFSLAEGEILGLLGPNGAGKTTTIHMMLSTLAPTSGTIEIFGKNLVTHRSEILREVSFASTYINLPAYLSMEENLIIHGALFGLSLRECRARMEHFLHFFKLWEHRTKKINALSAGQKTRTMLTKAFMTNPKLLLLDEPTASLDPDVAHEVRQFILEQQRKEKMSVLFTSHNMDEVTFMCDRVLVLRNGTIFADDTPEKLAASISHARVELVVGDGMKRTIAYATEHSIPYHIKEQWIQLHIEEHRIAELLTNLAHADVRYSQISIEKPSLEDYFIEVAHQRINHE